MLGSENELADAIIDALGGMRFSRATALLLFLGVRVGRFVGAEPGEIREIVEGYCNSLEAFERAERGGGDSTD